MWVVVNLVGYLVDAGQGVQYLHVRLGQPQHVVVQNVNILDALVFHEVREALLLHAGHVEDVGVGNNLLVEGRVLLVLDALALAVEFVLLGHLKLLGRHEVERGVEVAHGHEQRVDGAAILQVAHHVDVQVLERALGLVDAVQVEHALRGVLVGTVAGVDDGHGGHLGGVDGCSLDVVAHDDDVGIVGHHQDGIFQRLALGAAGNLRVGKADDARPQAVGGCFKRKSGAGAGFKEEGGDDLALEQFTVGMPLKLFCHLNHVEDLLACEIGNGDKIMLFHRCFWCLMGQNYTLFPDFV